MTDYIDEAFGPGGHLARALPGYETRKGQVDLARAVDRAIRGDRRLLGEAGTGVGKSFAYLVPAIWHADNADDAGLKTLVVTANLNLQDQLAGKDLPFLQKVLPWRFDFAVLKGRSNYLCLDRRADSLAESVFGSLFGRREESEQWAAISDWAETTESGDVAELPFEALPAVRPRFTLGSEDCIGRACPRHGDCFANKARERAESAQIVVANYHLLFAHLQVVRASGGEAGVLPQFDVLILDEANKAADIARDFFGSRVTRGSVAWATRLLAGKDDAGGAGFEAKERAAREADRFFAALAEHDPGKTRITRRDAVRDWRRFVSALERAADAYVDKAGAVLDDPAEKEKLKKCRDRCESIAAATSTAMLDPTGDEDRVHFVDRQGDRVALASKAIDVSDRLRVELFDRVRTSVCTSATLRVGSSFDFFIEETGLDTMTFDVEELVAESPFDFARQCLLVVPREAPDPKSHRFQYEIAQLFAETAFLAGGRTLGLFTSHKNLLAACDHARARLPYKVMRQGEAPRQELVRRFKEDVSSVLLGAESFWSGVDVPGEALSCVVMDRLPFPNPADPVMDALSERDDGAFKSQSLPRAVVMFRQGFGRLIRTTADRGVVVCLDARLVAKPYGKAFLKSLPPGVRLSRDLADVGRFLASSAA